MPGWELGVLEHGRWLMGLPALTERHREAYVPLLEELREHYAQKTPSPELRFCELFVGWVGAVLAARGN